MYSKLNIKSALYYHIKVFCLFSLSDFKTYFVELALHGAYTHTYIHFHYHIPGSRHLCLIRTAITGWRAPVNLNHLCPKDLSKAGSGSRRPSIISFFWLFQRRKKTHLVFFGFCGLRFCRGLNFFGIYCFFLEFRFWIFSLSILSI